jgi:phosphatidylserine/phosphatidylglycerophosphate/cardiolipin synthase-like enzyme
MMQSPEEVIPENAEAPLFVEGETCWKLAEADRAAVLIDGASYFGALRASLLKAEHSIYIVGWEINSRVRLRGAEKPRDGAPQKLGPLLRFIAARRPSLAIRILLWDFSLLYAFDRELFPRWVLGRNMPPQVEVALDDRLPLGACHHEKLVVIDDAVAYCGGMDLTLRRWDTSLHLRRDPRRVLPGGERYDPSHDMQLVVDGEAAAALGERVRRRWRKASGGIEPAAPPGSDPWPSGVAPDFERVRVAIMRTSAARVGQAEIREVERATVAAIASARRLIYIENQYITAKSAADALRARMIENPDLRVLIVTARLTHGWLEAKTMGVGRKRFMEIFSAPELARRIHFFYPVATRGTLRGALARRAGRGGASGTARGDGRSGDMSIEVHAKLLVVDDRLLRIGSSNLNNRSMGFDTECDVAIEASSCEQRAAIEGIRNRLLAEHLDADPRKVAAALEANGRLDDALFSIAGRRRALRTLPFGADSDTPSELVLNLGDPERVVTPRRLVRALQRVFRPAFGK